MQLFSVATHRQLGRSLLNVSTGPVDSLAFSPDGRLLVTGDGQSGSARLWNVNTHQEDGAPLVGSASNTTGIYLVAFSPDGTVVAGEDGDGAIILWDAATRQQIGKPLTEGNGVGLLGLSAGGTLLEVENRDGTAQLWNVSYLHDPLARLCAQIGGTLTLAEWNQNVPPGPAYRNVCP